MNSFDILGCKIKALRAKTNTYIKTPVRGEEPVFVVTGRKEDVASAKREILSAAEHFSQIRAQRKSNLSGGGGLVPGMGSGGLGIPGGPNGPNPNIPGQTTIQVRVPYRVVGLVVGPKGATIKRIQQQTNTYIITPSRDKEPIFEVTGLPESVETAKTEIEAHIATRTGGFIGDTGIPINGPNPERERDTFRDRDHFSSSGFHARSTSPLFKSDAFGSFSSRIVGDNNSNNNNSSNSLFNSRSSAHHDIFNFGSKFGDLYSSFGTSSFGNNNNNHHHSSSGSTATTFGLYESADEGLGDSPTFTDSLVASTNSSSSATSSGSSSAWPDFGSKAFASVNSSLSLLERRGSASLGSEANSTASSSSSSGGTASSQSPTAEASDSCGVVGGEVSGRRLSTDPLTSAFVNAVTSAALGFSALSGSTTTSSSPTESLTSLGSLTGGAVGAGSIGGGRKGSTKRDCIVCFEGEIQAALIPCGHNLFW